MMRLLALLLLLALLPACRGPVYAPAPDVQAIYDHKHRPRSLSLDRPELAPASDPDAAWHDRTSDRPVAISPHRRPVVTQQRAITYTVDHQHIHDGRVHDHFRQTTYQRRETVYP